MPSKPRPSAAASSAPTAFAAPPNEALGSSSAGLAERWAESTPLGGRGLAALLAGLVLAICLGLGFYYDQLRLTEAQAEQRREYQALLHQASDRFSWAIASRAGLIVAANGLVQGNRHLTHDSFAPIASRLVEKHSDVLRLRLAENGIVSLSWPDGEIGRDLLNDPTLGPGAQLSRREGRTWVGVIPGAVKGNAKLIIQHSIFAEPTVADKTGFWGLALLEIDIHKLRELTGLDRKPALARFGVRQLDPDGIESGPRLGDKGSFERNPVRSTLTLSLGSFELVADPLEGWMRTWPGRNLHMAAFVMGGLVAAMLVYMLLLLPRHLRRTIAHTRKRLARSEDSFREAIESLPDGFVVFDAKDRPIHWNDKFLNSYAAITAAGATPSGKVPRHYVKIVEQLRTSPQILSNTPLPPRADSPQTQEWELALRDGRWFRLVEQPVRGGGRVSQVSDITKTKRREAEFADAKNRAEAANQAKNIFLATISHEVRTPMNGVLGLLGELLEEPLSSRERTFASTARESAQLLLRILNDLLDLSRMEAGGFTLEPSRFALEPLLQGCIELTRSQADERCLALHLELEGDLASHYLGDAGRLRQILLNLLHNAVKFTEHGSVTLRARSCGNSQDSTDRTQMLCLEVEDTGIGVPATERQRMFEPFQQLQSGPDRRYGGAGLGLAICRRLVDAMNGNIKAHSATDGGTRIAIELPLPRVDALPGDQPQVAALNLRPGDNLETGDTVNTTNEQTNNKDFLSADTGETLKILLAEDDATNRLVIRAMLKRSGAQLDEVVDGRAAVDAVIKQPYDLVLMDIFMPELDGIAATQQIRARSGIAQPTIIALTANAMDGDRERFLAAGMDDYLAKPVDKEQLLAVLRHWSSAPATQ